LCKEQRAHNVLLQLIKEGDEVRSPAVGRDGLAVGFRYQGVERLDRDLKPGAEAVVKVAEADKGAQTLIVRWQRPILHQVKLGFGGAVSIGRNVVTNVLEMVFQEVAFP
jgi:hypothetical protein